MRRSILTVFAFVVAACSASTASAPSSSGTNGSSGSTPGTSSGSSGAATALPFKSYVILGDSISDRGGEGPFFYDLLETDLKAKLGDVKVVKASKAGARSGQLPGQVTGLVTSLPGPVAVSVTIGGNDMQSAALAIIQKTDDADRKAFADNLVKAYDELTRAGRFGDGVVVKIFHANIYDPSDGQGNYAESGCPGLLGQLPKQPTTGFFDNWNKAAADAIAKYGDAVVTVDIRGAFQGHGVSHLKDGTSWYFNDCIHPDKAGHDDLRAQFLGAIAP